MVDDKNTRNNLLKYVFYILLLKLKDLIGLAAIGGAWDATLKISTGVVVAKAGTTVHSRRAQGGTGIREGQISQHWISY